MTTAAAFTCRVCGRVGGHEEVDAREMMFGSLHPFRYLRCGACGCLQIAAVPANLADYYGDGYYSFGADLDAEFSDPAIRTERGRRVRDLVTGPTRVAREIEHTDMRRPLWALRRLRPARSARILDVGCGAGRLLYQLRNAGWSELLGVDPFLDGDRAYRNGLSVRRCELEDVEGSWDIIMFHHVFEHLRDPAGTLSLAAARLARGGTCLVRIPLAESDAFDRYRGDWVQLDAPRHLHLHTRKSLDIAAKRAGLRVAAVDYDSYELQFWGSEQYRQGIPLQGEGSYRWGHGAPIFSPDQIRAWKAEADRLNRRRRGDQACFYLRHARGKGWASRILRRGRTAAADASRSGLPA